MGATDQERKKLTLLKNFSFAQRFLKRANSQRNDSKNN